MTDLGATRPSPLEAAVARVGDRWSLLLIDALLDRPQRFNELQEAVAGISTNVLSARLKHLETERLVVARPYQDRPVRHAYELTASGRDLGGALRLLAQWGGDQEGDHATAHEHAPCGTQLEVRWYCPTCDEVVDADHLDETPYL
jgi:DNA-binding HxlR family transcriptional regulator